MTLESTDLITVAKAFLQVMYNYDSCKNTQDISTPVDNSNKENSKSDDLLEKIQLLSTSKKPWTQLMTQTSNLVT